MVSDFPKKALKSIVTKDFYDKQSETSGARKYVAYSFTQGLRKAMGHLNPDEIQELDADRSFNTGREDLSAVTGSSVSDIMTGQEIHRNQFELAFNRGDYGTFPWTGIQSVLGPSTIYDLPVRRLVVRFDNEEFEQEWKKAIKEALDISDPPLEWIEPPFFALLASAEPGDSDARENVRNLHEDFYYKPMFEAEESYQGMDWSIRSLDLEAVWSYQGFVNRPEPIFTTHHGDRQYDWTPRQLEKYIVNFFDPNRNYTGVLRNDEFATLWRRTYSLNVTSEKVFAWEEDEEWVQTD